MCGGEREEGRGNSDLVSKELIKKMKEQRVSFGVVMLLMALVMMGMGEGGDNGEEEVPSWRICRQDMGVCISGDDCAHRCAAAHPGGQGACKFPPRLDRNPCLCTFPC